MTKDAFYFPHDSNAKDDPKVVMMIEQIGLESYGIFWVLVEILRDQPDFKYPVALIPAVARRYNTTSEKVKAVIMNYGLFQTDDDEFFFSQSLNNRMIPLMKKKEQGRLAVQKRWDKQRQLSGNKDGNTDVLPTYNGTNTDLIPKRREEKRREEIRKEDKIREREEKFYNDVAQFTHTYSKKMLREFFDYWTEQNKSGTHMRYELEKTWDLSKRLARWAKTEKADPASTENHIPASMKKIKKLDQ